jgi:hypothetical protein
MAQLLRLLPFSLSLCSSHCRFLGPLGHGKLVLSVAFHVCCTLNPQDTVMACSHTSPWLLFMVILLEGLHHHPFKGLLSFSEHLAV